MHIRYIILFFLLVGVLSASERVILLHGLARSSDSMSKLEETLEEEGFLVSNIGYPSRRHTIPVLSAMVKKEIDKQQKENEVVHVVTHSMGGILLRYIQDTDPIENLGKVVMLSPPNQGSEIVDELGGYKLFGLVNGPAGNQLGTKPDGFVHSLGAINFELGIITGDRSINPILSVIIPGPDDGKVSVERAKVNGMKEFKVVHATHPLIMKNKQVHRNVLSFIRHGTFQGAATGTSLSDTK